MEPGPPPAAPPVVRWPPQSPSWIALKLLIYAVGLGFIIAAVRYRTETAAAQTATCVVTVRRPANSAPAAIPPVKLRYDNGRLETCPTRPVSGLADGPLLQGELTVPLQNLGAIVLLSPGAFELLRLYGPEGETLLRLEPAALRPFHQEPVYREDRLTILVRSAGDGSSGRACAVLPRPTVAAGPSALPFLLGWTLAYGAVFAVVGALLWRLWRFNRERGGKW